MKKIIYLVLSFLTLGIVACSSDKNDGEEMMAPVVVGVYNLTEINVSTAQDVNEDGVASSNLLEELSCLNGELTISSNGTWTLDLTDATITSVTGDFYGIRCGDPMSYTGSWTFSSNILNLNSSAFATFNFNETTLTENVGEDLPGIIARTYVR